MEYNWRQHVGNPIYTDRTIRKPGRKARLVEVKFEEDIKDRQKEFFEQFKAKHKRVIRGYQDLDELEALLQKTES
ncbi:MAG: hypothetical protein PVH61_32080 [Candidatus Aminicenantes bacterium]